MNLATMISRVAQRVRVEQLDRAEPTFLGDQPHGEQRDDDQKIEADVVDEEVLPEVLQDVHAEAERHVAVERGVEAIAGREQERADDHVDQRAGEVGRQLLPDERRASSRRGVPLAADETHEEILERSWAAAGLPGGPEAVADDLSASARRASSPRDERTTTVTTPSGPGSSRTSSSSGSARSARRTRLARDRRRGRASRAEPCSRRVRPSAVSSAMMRP